MGLKRGDEVTVALQGEFKKPGPAVVIESDIIAPTEFMLVCPMTTHIREDVALRRVLVQPSPENGLREMSQVQADKIHIIRRAKHGSKVGALAAADMERLDGCLPLVTGLLDRVGHARP